MKFGSRSKSKSKSSASPAAGPPPAPAGRSPASSTSSFISVGVLMDQRERPRGVTVEEVDDLDCAYEAMSLDGGREEGLMNSSHDELFEAYTGYMEVIQASVASRSKPQRLERPPAARYARPGAAMRPHEARAPALPATNPYIRSMHDVMDKKRGSRSVEGSGAGKGKGKASSAIKATGVTRRLMEEVTVARENMHLFNRLISVLPSSDVARRRLLKDFYKSRELLDKISRFPQVPAPEENRRDGKPAWDENWVGCMVV